MLKLPKSQCQPREFHTFVLFRTVRIIPQYPFNNGSFQLANGVPSPSAAASGVCLITGPKRGGVGGGWGERGTPYNNLYGEAPPEMGTFFGLQVYKRVGISLVEVYEG